MPLHAGGCSSCSPAAPPTALSAAGEPPADQRVAVGLGCIPSASSSRRGRGRVRFGRHQGCSSARLLRQYGALAQCQPRVLAPTTTTVTARQPDESGLVGADSVVCLVITALAKMDTFPRAETSGSSPCRARRVHFENSRRAAPSCTVAEEAALGHRTGQDRQFTRYGHTTAPRRAARTHTRERRDRPASCAASGPNKPGALRIGHADSREPLRSTSRSGTADYADLPDWQHDTDADIFEHVEAFTGTVGAA